jgi:membrane fusion protein (multidrug efflux system)
MKTRYKKGLFIIVIILSSLLLYDCGSKANSQANKDKKEEEAIPVETAEVTTGTIAATYASTTNLEAEAEALVAAKVSGVVEKIFVEEGDSVRAGQVLAKLDDELYKLELHQAHSTVEQLANEFERNQALLTTKVISQEAFEKTKSEYYKQKATYDMAELRVDYTEIKAPISGIVSQRLIKAGNMVKVDQPTFQVTDFDPLLAVLHVPEKELSKLRVGFPARLAADAVPDSEFKGKISLISPIVNADTGTFKVTVEVNDKTRQLKPGMFARVQVVYDTHENTLLVPKSAILTEDSEAWVFTVDSGTVTKREVIIGFSNSTHVEILSGLSAASQVVTTGLGSLKDGSKIRVIEP